MQEIKCDICIVGAGLVGQTAAIALSKAGFDVVVCAPKLPRVDRRTTALLIDSVEYLQKLGIWDAIADKPHPLKTMRIVDGTNRLVRTPQTDFNSTEIGLEAFGYNVQNELFGSALSKRLEEDENIRRVDGAIEAISEFDGRYSLAVKQSEHIDKVNTAFVVGADGKNSLIRNAMNVGEREWRYPQSAIVLDFEHQFPTRFTSTEFHTETGPFTIVPRSENIAGLVWMEKPERVEELLKLDRHELAVILERKMQSFLGKLEIITEVQAFPLKGLVANKFGEGNWALIGEAAHVFPPIGAQGFNLGIRDVQTLADTLGRFTSTENRGSEYSKARVADINIRTYGVDLLNRTTISELLPVHLMRSFGLHTLDGVPALRKIIMRLGISPKFRANR